jgi:hypothetical protein
MNKEREELLKTVNFPFIHPTSTDSPRDKTVNSTPNKNATTTARSSTWEENATVTTMTTEVMSKLLQSQRNRTIHLDISKPPVKKKEVGNNHNPTPPPSIY